MNSDGMAELMGSLNILVGSRPSASIEEIYTNDESEMLKASDAKVTRFARPGGWDDHNSITERLQQSEDMMKISKDIDTFLNNAITLIGGVCNPEECNHHEAFDYILNNSESLIQMVKTAQIRSAWGAMDMDAALDSVNIK